jgi:glutamine synthetase
MANTVICTMMAQAFCRAADALQGAQDPEKACRAYIAKLWKQHSRVVFNGDCYSAEWAQEAQRRGLPAFTSMVDAVSVLESRETRQLFTQFGVFSPPELDSRAEVLYENYAKRMGIEARVMLDMVAKDYIPGVISFLNTLDRSEPVQGQLYASIAGLLQQVSQLQQLLQQQSRASDAQSTSRAVAYAFRDSVVPVMARLRSAVDALEALVGRQFWPVPTYSDLLLVR